MITQPTNETPKFLVQSFSVNSDDNRESQVRHPVKAGDCDLCGEWSSELKGGACKACCEQYHIK